MNRNLLSSTLAVFFILTCFISCSPKKKYYNANQKKNLLTQYNQKFIKTALYQQFSEWRETPYQAGGLNKKGIDCSGLVYVTFRYQFGLELPRTTRELASIGKSVQRDDLIAGDLLFFKTGFWSRHVGIFIEGDNFLHSSSSRGVVISSLDDTYWQEAYNQAKRIEFP